MPARWACCGGALQALRAAGSTASVGATPMLGVRHSIAGRFADGGCGGRTGGESAPAGGVRVVCNGGRLDAASKRGEGLRLDRRTSEGYDAQVAFHYATRPEPLLRLASWVTPQVHALPRSLPAAAALLLLQSARIRGRETTFLVSDWCSPPSGQPPHSPAKVR